MSWTRQDAEERKARRTTRDGPPDETGQRTAGRIDEQDETMGEPQRIDTRRPTRRANEKRDETKGKRSRRQRMTNGDERRRTQTNAVSEENELTKTAHTATPSASRYGEIERAAGTGRIERDEMRDERRETKSSRHHRPTICPTRRPIPRRPEGRKRYEPRRYG